MRPWTVIAICWALSCSLWAIAALPSDADDWNNYATIIAAGVTIVGGAYVLGRSA